MLYHQLTAGKLLEKEDREKINVFLRKNKKRAFFALLAGGATNRIISINKNKVDIFSFNRVIRILARSFVLFLPFCLFVFPPIARETRSIIDFLNAKYAYRFQRFMLTNDRLSMNHWAGDEGRE